MPGIYIHIPFCKQACHYCNFHFSTSLRKKEAFIAAICEEIELVAEGENVIDKINTIYFGGGTPSILNACEVELMLKKIFSFFSIQPDAEITLEANPDDINQEKLQSWESIGINRLSIGIQSFFGKDLQWMNRAHDEKQAYESLHLAKKYFDNITIDLIYGIPGLTDEQWKQNVQTAIDAGIVHLSCYALTVEPKTPLHKLIKEHKKPATDDSQQSRQFSLLMEWLERSGYEHYEISNFAKPGYRSRHNSSYWNGETYIGIGPAAHSYNGKSRRWNVANNQQYIDAINKNIIPFEEEILTPSQKINEYIMTGLRTSEGIDLNKLNKTEMEEVLKISSKYIDRELLMRNGNCLQLTKQGKFFADGIAADLFK